VFPVLFFAARRYEREGDRAWARWLRGYGWFGVLTWSYILGRMMLDVYRSRY
jgi:hypothetical protein